MSEVPLHTAPPHITAAPFPERGVLAPSSPFHNSIDSCAKKLQALAAPPQTQGVIVRSHAAGKGGASVNPGPYTLDLNPGPYTLYLNPGPYTLNLNPGPYTLNPEP